MSVFADLSQDYAKIAGILSEFESSNIPVYPHSSSKIEDVESFIMAMIIGLKPSIQCSIDGGCTLDRGIELGFAKLAYILGFVMIEGDVEANALGSVREKLDRNGFFVVPQDRVNAALNLVKEIINRLGDLYNEDIKNTNLDSRIKIRKNLHTVVHREWDKWFHGKPDTGKAKENV